MTRMTLPVLVFILLCFTALSAAAQSAQQAYRDARVSYNRLQGSIDKQQYRENWQRVIDGFQAVIKKFPDTTAAMKARYMVGKTTMGLYEISRRDEDARNAIGAFDALVAEHGHSRLADDGLLHGADLARKISDFSAATKRYQRIVDDYPKGDMYQKARHKLKLLDRIQPVGSQRTTTYEAASQSTADDTPANPVPPSADGAASLHSIRHWTNPTYTRVVLDLNGEATYTANVLGGGDNSNGARLYIDLADVLPAEDLPSLTKVANGLLSQIRVGQNKDRTRVVFDLQKLSDYKVFHLSNPHRVVVDIRGEGKQQRQVEATETVPSTASDPEDRIAGVLNQSADKPQTTPAPVMKAKDDVFRIVVDAGHGGKDPGAIGKRGTQEKRIVLAIAKALKTELQKIMQCEVILTRSTDRYLPLDERTAIANKVKADLFISLHANANRSRKPYGFETYFLNLAKEDKAAELAARENGTTLKEVGNLEAILFDLMANAKINESSRLATEIQRSLVLELRKHYSSIKDLGVRQGPFYVLLGATMPSVLVETAFISNPREEQRLRNATFRKRTARAIAKGVKAYAESMQLVSR